MAQYSIRSITLLRFLNAFKKWIAPKILTDRATMWSLYMILFSREIRFLKMVLDSEPVLQQSLNSKLLSKDPCPRHRLRAAPSFLFGNCLCTGPLSRSSHRNLLNGDDNVQQHTIPHHRSNRIG